MTRILLALVVLISMAAQQQTPERRDDKYKDDPHAYCWNPATSGSAAPRRKQDASAHECHCRLLCVYDDHGQPAGDAMDERGCELYCTKTRCRCHEGEEVCEKPGRH